MIIVLMILFWIGCGIIAAGWYQADESYGEFITPFLSTLLGTGFLLVWFLVRFNRRKARGWENPYHLSEFEGGWFKDKPR